MISSNTICMSFAIIVFALTCSLTATCALPFVLFHGIADNCTSEGPKGVKTFTNSLKNWSHSEGYCVEIGDGVRDSWFMPLEEQTEIACEKVKNISELSEGYNIVGLSQGNMVARGVIEFCDGGPPVNNYISIAGTHAGISSIPLCGSEFWCNLVNYLIKLAVYSSYVQEHLAPAGFVKIPTDIAEYLKGCKFLPKLNNELVKQRNSTYKTRFASLQNLVLIMFEQDTVIVPKESSLFGYYPDGSWNTVLPVQETELYKEDWIGLKTLNGAGKVKFINVTGDHLEISESDIKNYIVPYLKGDDISIRRTMYKLHKI